MFKYLLTSFLSLSLVSSQAQSNHYNLDFEALNQQHLPQGWAFGGITENAIPADSVKDAFRIDSVNKVHGKYSLLIDWSKPHGEWTAITYAIHQPYSGHLITLKGYVKTKAVGSAALWMRIDGDGKVLAFDNMANSPISGTTDWKQYSITLPYSPDDVKDVAFGGLIEGSGKMWIDNLALTVDSADISTLQPYVPNLTKAELDTEYNNGSGITSIGLNEHSVKDLTNLGMLWGFIKYYHASVAQGGFNMDAALFRVLPKVIAAKDSKEANTIMETWVDGFGKPAACSTCKKVEHTTSTTLMPDFGNLFSPGNLPQSLINKLDYIKQNRYEGDKHFYACKDQDIGVSFEHENAYKNQAYPDAGLRLLSLYRYWNMFQYFSPSRGLVNNWNAALTEFIPAFVNAKDTLAYQLACLRLITSIHDSHADVWGGGTAIEKMKGNMILPVRARFIDKKLVVTGYYKDLPSVDKQIKPGDVIEKIDGTTVSELVSKYLPLTSASNYETQLRNMSNASGFLLRGSKRRAQLTIDRDSLSQDIDIPRIEYENEMLAIDYNGARVQSAYSLLPGNIGYIYPALLKDGDLSKIKEEFGNTDGIIIDLRCYPAVFMPYSYAKWLKPDSSAFVKFSASDINIPGEFDLVDTETNGGASGDAYHGKLVIIVNDITQSRAEFTAMGLATTPEAITIGSKTAGADGGIFNIVLPGGISTAFTGVGVYYPDGTVTQQAGIKIDKIVKPTIEGIKDYRDELLEAAEQLIHH